MTPFLAGLRATVGAPMLVLFASFLGFGSLVQGNGLSLAQGLVSTTFVWALPGQITMIEVWAAGGGAVVVVLAVALTNLRLLPMAMTMMPHLRRPGTPRWQLVLAAHIVAVTSWVIGMQRCPELPHEQRMPFFFGVGFGLWAAGACGTAIGFLLAGSVPAAVSLGLVFLNPVYFLLILMPRGLSDRPQVLSLVFGAALGPLLHLLTPDWGLLATGLIAGTAAYWLGRKRHV